MPSRERPDVQTTWRDTLLPGDEVEINKWILQSGFERVARILSVLASAPGRQGPTSEPDSDLMMRMARRKLQDRSVGNHTIAELVVSESDIARQRNVDHRNIVETLRDKFNEQQHAWLYLAKNRPGQPSEQSDADDLDTPQAKRILMRLVEVLDRELNAYDKLLRDAKRIGPEAVHLVLQTKRRKLNEIIERRLEEAISGCAVRPDGKIPRSLFDLVELDLKGLA